MRRYDASEMFTTTKLTLLESAKSTGASVDQLLANFKSYLLPNKAVAAKAKPKGSALPKKRSLAK